MGDKFRGEKEKGKKRKRKEKERKERKGKRENLRERGRRLTGSSSVHWRFNCQNLLNQELKLVYSTRATRRYRNQKVSPKIQQGRFERSKQG